MIEQMTAEDITPETIWIYDDGGRASAGFKSKKAGDCVVRAIAIISGKPYLEVFNTLGSRFFKKDIASGKNPNTGVPNRIFKRYLKELGFVWTPLMFIGSGCKVHLTKEELPMGNIICRTSGHLVAVKDGVIFDNHDPSRDGNRCVYGYWKIEGVGK